MKKEEKNSGINERPKRGKRVIRRGLRGVAVLGIVIGGVVLAGGLFLMLNPVFGGRASKEQQGDYAERAANYVDGRFTYPEE